MCSPYYVALLFFFTTLIPGVYGQTEVLIGDERDYLVREMIAAYPEQFQSIEITAVKRLDDHFIQLNYVSEGRAWEVILQNHDPDPLLVETAHELSPERWPALIVDAWKKRNSDDRIMSRILKISTPYGKQGYRVDSVSGSPEKRQVDRQYFDLYGQPMKPFY